MRLGPDCEEYILPIDHGWILDKCFRLSSLQGGIWIRERSGRAVERCHDPTGKRNRRARDFPGGAVLKNLPAKAGDTGLIPGPGRSHMPQTN